MALNYTNEWDFSAKHLDDAIGQNTTDFLSSARCIIYAKLSSRTAEYNQSGFGKSDNIFKRIGVLQGFGFSEQKNIEQFFEIGSDIPFLVPGRTSGQISLQRILLAGEDLFNLVYRVDGTASSNTEVGAGTGFIATLRDPRMNQFFDLLFAYYGTKSGESSDSQTASNGGKFTTNYSTLFKNCLFAAKSESINAGSILISESCSIAYERISTVNFAAPSNATSFRGTNIGTGSESA